MEEVAKGRERGGEEQWDQWKTGSEVTGATENKKWREIFTFTCTLFKGKIR